MREKLRLRLKRIELLLNKKKKKKLLNGLKEQKIKVKNY
jgi:hypothetical protein